jgi:hypothetical protein
VPIHGLVLRNWFTEYCEIWGLGLDLIDANDPGALARAVVAGQTKLVWIATPCNSGWDIIDIAAAAQSAHAAGARLAVDSTSTKQRQLTPDCRFPSHCVEFWRPISRQNDAQVAFWTTGQSTNLNL